MKRAIALLSAGILIGAGLIPLHVLEIRNAKTGSIVFIHKVAAGEAFSIAFVHSVEKSPVVDYFRIDDAFRMVLYETAFRSLNTGLPASISEGQKFSRKGEEFRLSITQGVLPDIQLWVDEKYEGVLEIGGRKLSLAAMAGNTLLIVKVRSISFWEYAFRSMYG
jgi:hypothetical protein